MTPRRFACLLIGIALLTRASAAQDLAAKTDAFVKPFVDQHRFQGSVLLAREGKPLFRKSYGPANAEWDIVNTPDTKFRLGSITKQFTSALILQLVEQGKVRLDDPIGKYYTAAPESWSTVTIHHLLSHQSGIPSYTDLPGFFQKQSMIARTPAEIIELTEKMPLEFAPGSKYKYDNTGYILLGYVIEKVTGKKYEDELRSAILDPLGMKDTGYDHYTDVLPHRAEGYEFAQGKLRRAAYLDMSLPYAAGSLYSTVDDLSKWDQALEGDKVLTAASKDKMWTPNRNDYGYGWNIVTRWGERSLEHGGGINGFNTMIVRVPAQKLLAVVLSNVQTGATGPIAAGLIGLALDKPVGVKRQKIDLTAEAMRPLEGAYADGDTKLTLRVEGTRLVAVAGNQRPLPLEPMAPRRFFNDDANVEIEIAADGSAMTLVQNGLERKFKRQ